MKSFRTLSIELNHPIHVIKRVWYMVAFNGEWRPENVKLLTWGAGRPLRLTGVTNDMAETYATDYNLTISAHLSIPQRVRNINVNYGSFLKEHNLRAIHRMKGVTQQKLKRYLGPQKYKHWSVQNLQIQQVQQQLAFLKANRIPCFQIDASCFNDRHFTRRAWARKNLPLAMSHRYGQGPYIAVYAAICAERGMVYWEHRAGAAFKGGDIIEFLWQIKCSCALDQFGIFCDNASVHKTPDVKRWCEDNGVTMIYNLEYRPDLNGIEYFWAVAKHKYRTKLLEEKAHLRKYD